MLAYIKSTTIKEESMKRRAMIMTVVEDEHVICLHCYYTPFNELTRFFRVYILENKKEVFRRNFKVSCAGYLLEKTFTFEWDDSMKLVRIKQRDRVYEDEMLSTAPKTL